MKKKLVTILLAFSCLQRVRCDFVYYDFNRTHGLALNGDAGTSNCIRVQRNEYSDRTGINDEREAELEVVQHQGAETLWFETKETENMSTSSRIEYETATFRHRQTFENSEEELCASRLRLTASSPHQISSTWYSQKLPVVQGFETKFTFQILDQSKHCMEVLDHNFGLNHYKSCYVHGGDGFAFVIHANADGESTVGGSSSQHDTSELGYDGISNSIAIEFDTWYNAEHSDTMTDHVAIYSNGVDENSVRSSRLSRVALHDLADGQIHVVKIRYFDEIKMDYVPYFSSTENLPKFIQDVSEGRRMGTLAVFMDNGIDTDTPLLAIPINIAATLQMPTDEAFVGFTSSTGDSWQKHDVLGWYYCTQPPCSDQYGTEMTFDFDYNEQSMQSSASHLKNLYPIYIFPDSEAWARKPRYFAPDQQVGLAK